MCECLSAEHQHTPALSLIVRYNCRYFTVPPSFTSILPSFSPPVQSLSPIHFYSVPPIYISSLRFTPPPFSHHQSISLLFISFPSLTLHIYRVEEVGLVGGSCGWIFGGFVCLSNMLSSVFDKNPVNAHFICHHTHTQTHTTHTHSY